MAEEGTNRDVLDGCERLDHYSHFFASIQSNWGFRVGIKAITNLKLCTISKLSALEPF